MTVGNRIDIVVTTPKSAEEFKESIEFRCLKEIKRIKNNVNIVLLPHNKTGLPKVYNNYLKNKSDGIVTFIHDDVEIHDLFLSEKLISAHENYDIVGLAGATTQDYTTNRKLAWHLCKINQTDSSGIVSHYIPKGFSGVEKSHYNSAYFGGTPSQVAVLDGLFISVDVKKVKDKLQNKPLFDEDFDWHHYDMSMACIAKDNGVSLGTWPIFVIHHGLGDSMNSLEWDKSSQIFKNKYGNKKL